MSPGGELISIEYPIISMNECRENTAFSIHKERRFKGVSSSIYINFQTTISLKIYF